MHKHKIVLSDRSPDDGIRFKNQLLADGLAMGPDHDFVWYYQQAAEYHCELEYTQQLPRQVIFEFQDGALATYYGLKWI
jgi:hypothetical protein